jgi:hypothetical protein
MKINKDDLRWAATQGLISTEQAEALWEALMQHTNDRPQFNTANVAFYFGALIVISAMTWFMNIAWESFGGSGIFALAILYALCFMMAGNTLWFQHNMRVPGGLLYTIAVCMTPLAIYGLQRWTGFWLQSDPGAYQNFYVWIQGSWFLMELGTIITGLIALKYIRFPFLTAPIAFSLYFMSMDITPLIVGDNTSSYGWWELRLLISMWFGIGCIIVAYLVDLRNSRRKGDYAFWLYLFGLMAFWCGLSFQGDSNELEKFIYCLINLGLIVLSVILRRKVFIVFGALGVFGYLSHLAYNVFQNAVLFPIVLTAIGILIIYMGMVYQVNVQEIERFSQGLLPDFFKRFLPRD